MKRICKCGCGREFELDVKGVKIWFDERKCSYRWHRRHAIRRCTPMCDPDVVQPMPSFAQMVSHNDWTEDWKKTREMATTGDVEVLMGAGR